MYEERIINYLQRNTIGRTADFHTMAHVTDEKTKRIINTEAHRLCKNGKIHRLQKGIYCCVYDTKWGKVYPTNDEIIEKVFVGENDGYYTGDTFLNKIGLLTLLPVKKEIVTNKYNEYKNIGIADVKCPKAKITKKK